MGLCVLEHGDGPVLGRAFLVNEQPLCQSLHIKGVRELREGTAVPVRLGSQYRVGCKAPLESSNGMEGGGGQKLCCEGANLGRRLITQVWLATWLLGSRADIWDA